MLILVESTLLQKHSATALHAQRALALLEASASTEDSDTYLSLVPLGHINGNGPLCSTKSDIKPEPFQISWNTK